VTWVDGERNSVELTESSTASAGVHSTMIACAIGATHVPVSDVPNGKIEF
jgi:hypothetical protein